MSDVNRRPYVVALTGGVAAGKSAVEARFRSLGVGVHDADRAARVVVEPGSPGLAAVVEAFGAEVLDAQGRLDRAAMRRRVFAEPAARRRLEAILHPLIRDWLRAQVDSDPGPYCLVAIPLLVENLDHYRWLDRVLLVDVPESTQLERLRRRDGIDQALAERMLSQQASRAERLAIADDVIDNSGDETALEAQIARLHRVYREQAAR